MCLLTSEREYHILEFTAIQAILAPIFLVLAGMCVELFKDILNVILAHVCLEVEHEGHLSLRYDAGVVLYKIKL
jgi:hypothetical protein